MTDQAPGGTGRGWALVGLVGVVVMIAAFAFGAGRLTAPSDEPVGVASPGSTTTTTIEVAIGEPLSWERAADIGETWPIAFVEHDGTLYLFGTPNRSFGFGADESTGLDAWVSFDGMGWESLGPVIPAPAQVHSVVSTPRGLLALGESAPNGQPSVWMSNDGTSWSASELPTTAAEPGSETFMSAAGANDAAIVVFGETYFNPEQALFEALPEELQIDRYGFGFTEPGFALTIYGPLGLALYTATAEDLGLSEEAVEALTHGGPFEEPGATIWRSSDAQTWTASPLEAGGVQQVWTSSDGALVATGWGFRGPETWTSIDGAEWDRQPLTEEIDIRGPWNDGVLGSRYFGPTEELLYSADVEEWTSLGVEEALPPELSWNYHPVATGETGIALVARGYDDSMQFEFEEPPAPIVLERDGYTLTADEMRGTLVLSSGEVEVLRLFMHTDRVHDEIEADLVAQTLTFLDPETGEALVTFTFEEIDQAQQESFGGFDDMGREQQVFMFSEDGVGWTAQNLTSVLGDREHSDDLVVAGDRVVLTVITEGEPSFSGPPSIPTVSIWTALFP